MLIDSIIETRFHQMFGALWNDALRHIAMSQKFVIGEHFALASEALSGDLDQLHRTLMFCRLPYPNIWIEVAQAHRPQYATPLHPLVPGQRSCDQITRIGWWVTALSDKLDVWQASMFWKFKPPHDETCQNCIYSMVFNGGELTADIDAMAKAHGSVVKRINLSSNNDKFSKTMNSGRLHICIPRHVIQLSAQMFQKDSRELEKLTRLQIMDWHGEVTFLLAAIALLNTKNVAEAEHVDRSKINKRRAKDGKRNLSSYHLLKIAPRFIKTMVRRGTGESKEEMRAHFVRGHWKTRKTGVFFWLPFVRGNKARGMVDKDYELV